MYRHISYNLDQKKNDKANKIKSSTLFNNDLKQIVITLSLLSLISSLYYIIKASLNNQAPSNLSTHHQ